MRKSRQRSDNRLWRRGTSGSRSSSAMLLEDRKSTRLNSSHGYISNAVFCLKNKTTIVDVSDPARPRKLAEITIPDGMHSHKVRVENDVMLVNREVYPPGPPPPDLPGRYDIYDVSRPSAPRKITTWAARGMHRFTFDGRYAYGSPEIDGYRGYIVIILD